MATMKQDMIKHDLMKQDMIKHGTMMYVYLKLVTSGHDADGYVVLGREHDWVSDVRLRPKINI